MAEIKWIKIVTDIFDNRKVKQIEALPDADSILVIWFKLICLAGSINDGGRIYFLEGVPYTDEMLATQFRRPLNTVRMALETFRQFGMIETIDDVLCLPSWEKYQSADKLEKIREQNRLRKRRERAKLLPPADMSRDCHVTVTQSHAIDKEEDKEIDRDIEIESKADEPPPPPRNNYQSIQSLYNTICKSLPRCTSLSDARKKAIAARINSGYTEDDFKRLFEKAESSSFLKGSNPRNWTANFDWLIKDANMAKVLDGNYDNKGAAKGGRREEVPDWMTKYVKPKKTAADDPAIKERAAQLQRDLKGR